MAIVTPESEAEAKVIEAMLSDAIVPCGTCHACCHSPVAVSPEAGDDPSLYKLAISVDRTAPNQHAMVTLDRKPDGSCYALRNGRCTIWDKRPRVCRNFDCRKMFVLHTKAERRELVAKGYFKRAVIDAGKARAGTLENGEDLKRLAARINFGQRAIAFMEHKRGVK